MEGHSGFHDLYLRLRTMSHTIYVAKFEQTIIHQHVHLRREIQSHAPANVLMRLYPIIYIWLGKNKWHMHIGTIVIYELITRKSQITTEKCI
jgi:hypothetical protein